MATAQGSIRFDNSYARDLDGLYVAWRAAPVPEPRLVALNEPLARDLGLDLEALKSPDGVAMLAGNAVPDGASPLAQAYAGHQFGGFSPQLGDGRALLLGEIVDTAGIRRDIQLKGSGPTPFSRNGDGKAALGPVLREYLIAEAMHALGIPTTRALAAVTTGEFVRRETALPGAILTRVASSHIRVGTFQFFAVRKDHEKLKRLADFSIERHYPEARSEPNPYLALFEAVTERQAALIAKWMLVGFVHGVMNTDNMTISGETIDYGPCAFLDAYDPQAVYSSIDLNGRYAYANQPLIAQWNLARFAETLIGLVHPESTVSIDRLTGVLTSFPERYDRHWLDGMRAKLGLTTISDGDTELANDLLALMAAHRLDFSRTFRALAQASRDTTLEMQDDGAQAALAPWLERWRIRLADEGGDVRRHATLMNQVNPAVIPRNHLVEEALDAAVSRSDYAPFHRLADALSRPFDEGTSPDLTRSPPPAFGPYRTFCGT